MQNNPVVGAQGVAAAVSAVIMLGLGMAVSLGWISLDTSQMSSIEKFVGAVLGLAILVGPQLVAAFWANRRVITKAEAAQMMAQQEQSHA